MFEYRITNELVLPIWKSNVSLTLMMDKKAKRFRCAGAYEQQLRDSSIVVVVRLASVCLEWISLPQGEMLLNRRNLLPSLSIAHRSKMNKRV